MDFKQIFFCSIGACLALLGPLAAIEFGGVLPWTHYVAGLGVCGLGAIAVVVAFTRHGLIGASFLRRFWPLLLWVVFTWIQVVRLEPSIVSVVSPGSYSAYTDWLEPLLPMEQLPGSFPISIAADLSRHAAAVMTLLLPLVFAVSVFCRERSQVECVLIALSVGIGLHAAFGIAMEFAPALRGYDERLTLGRSFGSFVNHNNAAFMLNLGLGCGIGIFVSRIAALTGVQYGPDGVDFGALSLVFADPMALVGLVSGSLSGAGLLMCGSRAGLVAGVVGCVLVAAWFNRGRGWGSVPAISAGAAFVLLIGFLLLAPFSKSFRSVERFDRLSVRSIDGLFNDVRFQHWPDGFRAAMEYLPAGSGIATYSYAYLPYQQSGSEAWFQHADNLWLELLVEQGLVGVAVAMSVLAMLLIALVRLSRSNEPLDFGLQAAGFYIIGATIWSQCFDFGLIVGGNLLAFTCFWAVVLSRCPVLTPRKYAVGNQRNSDSLVQFASPLRRMISVSVGGACLVAAVVCLPGLYRDAVCDSLERQAKVAFRSNRNDKDVVERQAQLLNLAIAESPSYELLDLGAAINRQSGRLQSVAGMNLESREDLRDAYVRTGVSARRKAWRNRPGEAIELPAQYEVAVRATEASLKRMPLGFESRGQLVALDFVHRRRESSHQALLQLYALQKRNPGQLARVAKLAVDGGDTALAARAWRDATQLKPIRSKEAVDFARSDPSISISDLISDAPECQRIAVGHALSLESESPEQVEQLNAFLTDAVGLLDCESCIKDIERTNCEQILADALLHVGRSSESIEHLREAVRFYPASVKLRVKLIRRVVQFGTTSDALELAQQAKQDFPEERSFQVLIDQMMAASDRQAEQKN
ncbi:O-antigen ligase family protein [Roseiconus lacunae]|uniref:O-antigen ligase family protein n=1 Tax=Roseiconus lacunae TaxID=2605694 RepID=UPI001E449FCD|nr:O-antigen ligase family protein [Roseiconus lacunae]MCD0458741.1 O-antigen ligase family protein [Roseiconus lacunae]